jgi:lipopolysaccharide biosynthesis regulator YciM
VSEYLPWLVGLIAVAVAAGTVWYLFRRPGDTSQQEELYQRALESWVEGELEEATALLKQVVQSNPNSLEPFLQLGNLLRIQGDPARAAVLHRGLTVRPGLSSPLKVSIGLALAEDLLALKEWEDARAVLDSLARHAHRRPRYWRARFRQFHGQDNRPEAARSLKAARKQVQEKDRPWFDEAYASYQLDRALEHVRLGELAEARPRLRDVEKMDLARVRLSLVKAMLAAADQDPAAALTLTADDLLDSPEELAVLLPVLQDVLLRSGQYARTIPILERACQSENAPPSLWIQLALLYEKLGQREKALRFLESKSGRGNFTPNAAAPLLRLLVADAPPSDLTDVWHMLNMPAPARGWACSSCGRLENGIRWFCPGCWNFNTFHPSQSVPEVGA